MTGGAIFSVPQYSACAISTADPWRGILSIPPCKWTCPFVLLWFKGRRMEDTIQITARGT
jgi:hypothetical protein